MANENIQPLECLKPMAGESAGDDLDPARKVYLEGR